MGACTFTWKWLLYEKKKNPERFAHNSEKASGSCTNLKILFQFILGISHSPAQNPTSHTDHAENNPEGQISTEGPPSTSHPILLQHYQSHTKKPHLYYKAQAQQSPALPLPGLKCREQGGAPGALRDTLRWHLLRWHRVPQGLDPAQGSAPQPSSHNREESPASLLKYGFVSPGEKGSAPLEIQQMVNKCYFIQGFALFALWQMPDNSTLPSSLTQDTFLQDQTLIQFFQCFFTFFFQFREEKFYLIIFFFCLFFFVVWIDQLHIFPWLYQRSHQYQSTSNFKRALVGRLKIDHAF